MRTTPAIAAALLFVSTGCGASHQTFDTLGFHHLIWVRSLPISSSVEETELRVLMRFCVEGIAGLGVAMTDVGEGRVALDARHYATRELRSGALSVDGRDAYAALIEVADVDQLQLSPDARWQRALIVMVRTDLVRRVAGGGTSRLLPVLLLFGYTNLPEDFERGVPDFQRLLDSVEFEADEIAARQARVEACAPTATSVGVWGQPRTFPALVRGVGQAQARCIQRIGFEDDRGYGFRPSRARRPPTPLSSVLAEPATTEPQRSAPEPAPEAPEAPDAPEPTASY